MCLYALGLRLKSVLRKPADSHPSDLLGDNEPRSFENLDMLPHAGTKIHEGSTRTTELAYGVVSPSTGTDPLKAQSPMSSRRSICQLSLQVATSSPPSTWFGRYSDPSKRAA